MRTSARFSLVVFALAASFAISAGRAGAQSPSTGGCLTDLKSIPAFLLANDAGAGDRVAQLGQKHFDDAMAEAEKSAARATTPGECTDVINRYLRAWRKGHLYVLPSPNVQAAAAEQSAPRPAQPKPSAEPTYRELSPKTILLTLPTFEYPMRGQLEALLKEHRQALATHPNWIVDVRDNPGGDDDSYEPLLPWLMPDERVEVGMEWLATPANIQAWSKVCAIEAPGDKGCQEQVGKLIEKLGRAPAGSWVPDDGQGGISYERTDSVEPQRPSRVAVLIDHACGSSCEQFALDVRQSFSVKLIGRHTYGSLDYSNLVPHTLPSGNLVLWYATSRTLRIPDQPVDVTGVLPDIYLPLGKEPAAKDDEIERVRNWLEGGSLAPLHRAAADSQAK